MIKLIKKGKKLPTSYYLFYNTLHANDIANDCRKKDRNIF
jgi:hypothetical protein